MKLTLSSPHLVPYSGLGWAEQPFLCERTGCQVMFCGCLCPFSDETRKWLGHCFEDGGR